MGEIAIRAQNVSKRFSRQLERRQSLKERAVRGRPAAAKEFWALRDASFEVERGTTFGIIGHNGSGKSTALKVLTGVYRPTSGLVDVRGRVSALLELGAGFHPELTGRENVRLNGAILGMSRRRIDAAMDAIIDFSGLDDYFVDSPVKVYSSGMYLRLGFAIAVMMDPDILVVDEIIAVGDEQFQRKCTDYLYKLRRDGATIVIVSHAMSQIVDMCDTAVWLDHGEVQTIGPARDTVQKYLNAVNADEIAARTDAPDHVPAAEGATGTGEIRITDIEFARPDHPEGAILLTGQPARIRLHYKAATALPRAVFGFLLHAETGQQVGGRNSLYELTEPIPAGSGTIDFVTDNLPLLGGNYLITTMVSDRSHIFDHRDKYAQVTVRSNDQSFAGTTALPGTWSIKTD